MTSLYSLYSLYSQSTWVANLSSAVFFLNIKLMNGCHQIFHIIYVAEIL